MSDHRRPSRTDRRRSRSPNDSRHNYHDDRDKRSRGDDSRGNHRDRERGAGKDTDRFAESSRGDQRSEKEEVSKTVIVKGLTAHTTEPALYNALAPYLPQEIRLIAERDTGDCKGFAFVAFPSIEHAQFFMMTFAGSTGDPNASQLIIGNRAVTLKYARDEKRERDRDRDGHGGDRAPRRSERDDRDRETRMKNDWLCDSAVGCDTPSTFLVVRGFGPFVSEDSIIDLFRQFAVVKSAYLLRDAVTGISKGVAFVEFHTIDHAVHTLQQTSLGQIHLDSSPLKIMFAKESFRVGQRMKFNEAQMQQQLLEQQQQQQLLLLQQQQHNAPPLPQLNRMAAEVLQSARWSGNSGFSGQPPTHPAPPKPPGSTIAPGVTLSKSKPAWPPSFETDGGAYVFQAQSGSFLEPKSQFFYCPKSKLYYSCADGIYYSCVVLQNETAFMRFNPPLPLEPEGTVVVDTVDKNTTVLDAARKPVVLSMGFNMGKAKNTGVKIINVASKKVIGDMLKWGSLQDQEEEAEKGRVMSQGGAKGKGKPSTSIPDKPSSPVAPVFVPPPTFVPPPVFSSFSTSATGPISVNNSGNSSSITDPRIAPVFAATSAADAIALITGAVAVSATPPTVAATGAGERVACLLCRRQFASQEQLLRHEKESKLHKDNMMLAVQAASDDVARQLAAFGASSSSAVQSQPEEVKDAASSSEGYRDRASERRATYQQTSQGGSAHRDRDRDRERGRDRGRNETYNSVQKSEVDSQGAPSSLQDVSNPGTQLLRKMGWNEGQGLGRGGTGAEESVGVILASQTGNNNGKRISGVGGSSGAIPQVDYRGSGREYKESLLRAAKARYDQVSKQ